MNEEGFATDLVTPRKEVARKPRKNALKNLMRRDGIWYFRKFVKGKQEFNGRKTPFSLETRDLEVAKAKRDAILKAANGAEVDRVLNRTSKPAATLGEIFKAYRAAPTVHANPDTRERNIADLERMVQTVKGDAFDVENASCEILTKQLVKEWQQARQGIIATAFAGELTKEQIAAEAPATRRMLERLKSDLAAVEAAKRSLNSLLTHVQSLFSAEARDDYGALYLPPNIEEFATALPVAARKAEEPVQLSDQFVSGLLAAIAGLLETDPGAWVAFQLMTWGGLRNKEVFHARAAWLEPVTAGIPPAITSYRLSMKPTKDFLPKGNSRAVLVPKDIAEAILALQPAKDPATGEQDDHLVPAAHQTDRQDAAYRRLNIWLKAQGVNEEAGKLAYRLRKYFLAKVAEQQGIMFAQAAGGHSSRRTTEEHYVGKPKMKAPINLTSTPPDPSGAAA